MHRTSILIAGGLAVCVAACAKSPTAPTTWSTERLREQLLLSNLNSPVFGEPGRVTRWRTPIPVHTGGIARVETALDHYEQWTSGLVRFTRVSAPPPNGLAFVVGGGGGPESSEACGSVGPAEGSPTMVFQWDQSRAITGAYIIHLGADRCDDEAAGPYPSSIAEHQLAHALGVIDHFDGFQHRGGLDDPRLLAVVYNLYANAPGTAAGELTIWGMR